MSDVDRPTSVVRRIVTAGSISAVGNGLHVVAFALLAASLTDDPRLVALVAAVGALPNLLFALPVGAFVDWSDRGRVLVVVDVLRGALLVWLVTMVLGDWIRLWHLIVAAVLLGVGDILFETAAFALLPEVLAGKSLGKANTRLAMANEVGDGLVGPALAGPLYALQSSLPFAANALSFLASAALLRPFAGRRMKSATVGETPAGPYREQLFAGLRWVRRHRGVRALALVVGAWSLFGWMPEATLVLYARDELGLGEVGFGLLFAATTAGAVVGGLAYDRMGHRLRGVRWLGWFVIAYGLLLLPPAFVGSPVIVGAVFFAQGLPLVAWISASRTVRQTVVPNQLLGRVGSVFSLVGAGVAPAGLFLGGVVGAWLGLRAVFVIAGVGLLASVLLASRGLRALEKEVNEASGASAADVGETGSSGELAPLTG
jgi:MFS family permease